MLQGGAFGKVNACFGIIGSILFMTYFVFTSFLPDMGSVAMALAIPGGLLMIVWMTLFAIRLFKLRSKKRLNVCLI
jgi:hypothetical protein